MTTHRFEGVHVIPVTPFTASGARVDHDALAAHIERLLGVGIRIVVPNGNTSEYQALSARERREALRTTIATVAGRAVVVAGVGGSTGVARAEARAAGRAGADAVMVHTPAHPFVTGPGWLRYHDLVAVVTDVPLVPYVRTAAVDARTIADLAQRPYTVAVKFAVADPMTFATAVSAAPTEVAWICGIAESWAPAFWAFGAVGFTSGLGNVVPEAALAMLDALVRVDGPRVRSIWTDIRPFERMRARDQDGMNVAVVKAALREAGHDMGPVRPPASDLPEAARADLAEALAALRRAATR